MKVLLSWLREYVDFDMTAADLAHRLTMSGLAVESVVESDPIRGVRIGRVLAVEKHPNADKLSLAKVDIGSQVLDIVCGASNVAAGQLVPVATVGTSMPGGLEIKKAKIRGVESAGMICSKSELGFEEGKSPGIWELDSARSHTLGQSFAEYQGLAETVLDLDITSNRPDCLSHIGVAREVASIANSELKWPSIRIQESKAPAANAISVVIEDPEGCPRYSARVVRGVRVGPSPDWIVRRLEAVGLRSINAVVDVTNYVMLETGQPLHAFDYDRISGHKIIVRKSRMNEEFTTLDGRVHKLNDQIVMICDGERAVALGGIMGGKNSEVSGTTTTVLLESACFDALTIRRGAKTLGISSDASMRFGRGIDIERVTWALDRAAALLKDLAGGEVLSGLVDVRKNPPEVRSITLRRKALQRLLVKDIPLEDSASILESLECRVDRQGEMLVVSPPSCRLDLNSEVDLIEEVARRYGYDNLPTSAGSWVVYDNESNRQERLTSMLRTTLRELGVDEVSTNSMVHPSTQAVVVPNAESALVRIMNPISDDMTVMRLSMLPSLLEVMRFNLHRDNTNVRIYEMGRTYRYDGNRSDGLATETLVLAGCLSGHRAPVNWDTKPEVIDFFDLKRIVTTICKKLNIDNGIFIPYYDNSVYEASSLEIRLDSEQGMPIGHFGRIRKSILREWDISREVWGFELVCSELLEAAKFVSVTRPIPRFPSVKRDLAFTVEGSLEAGRLMTMIREQAGPFLDSLEVFDHYRGDQVQAGKKSLAFALVFQARDRTLTEDEIEKVIRSLILKAGQQFGAQLRQ